MSEEKKAIISLSFLCSDEMEGETVTKKARDVASSAMAIIDNFISGQPEGSTAQERTAPIGADRRMDVTITVVVDAIAAAASLETLVNNNLGLFPPMIPNTKRFVYLSEEMLDVVDPVV
jgi:hypothetical protein